MKEALQKCEGVNSDDFQIGDDKEEAALRTRCLQSLQ